MAALDKGGQKLLDAVIADDRLTARGFNRVLRVARSLADLNERGQPDEADIATALVWRGLEAAQCGVTRPQTDRHVNFMRTQPACHGSGGDRSNPDSRRRRIMSLIPILSRTRRDPAILSLGRQNDLSLATAADASLAGQGDMRVRLARTAKEVIAAQALRYRIFYQNMGAQPKLAQRLRRRDNDHFDNQCAHLLLTTKQPVKGAPLATRLPGGETVIGCYRLLRRDIAEAENGFYSAGEFQLDGFLDSVGRGLNIVELGRSCVAAEFRSGRAIALLWKGLGQLVKQWQVDALIGCASFAGTNVDALAAPLSYLYHHHRADVTWQLQARDEIYVEMNRMARQEIDEKAAKRALPPVLKGYLRSGALVGNGAVIDRQFNTVDVFVIMPMTQLSDRYRARYAAE